MNRIFTFLMVALAPMISSCLRLDDNLYNPDNTIDSYLRDEYKGTVDFVLDASYKIPEHMIHEFTLLSQSPGEKDPTTIYAVYIGDINAIASDTVIMYCHGNRDHMDFYWQRAKLLAHTGGKNRFGVMMIDYRGYGLSGGKSFEAGLYADVNAALQWLKGKGLVNERLVMYGFSLGSAPATELTANGNQYALQPAKLILESPFASSAVMVQDAALLSMPASFFTNLKINNADKIKQVTQPLMWIHGAADDFLNIDTHGEVVFKNYKGPAAKAIRVAGAGHGSVPKVMGFETYTKELESFIIER